MKKIVFLLSIFSSIYSYAQINTQSEVNSVISNQNPFLDASGYINQENSIAKGLVFPRTDLTQFNFDISLLGNYQNFPTAFDGMIVFNTGAGKTGTNPATQGIQVDVEPGFYYFSHPTADEDTTDVSAGKWVRMGGAAEEAKKTTASGKEIFTRKGEFTLTTGDNGTSIIFPEGMTSLYSINIYRKDGEASHLVGSSLYTYKLGAGEGQKNIIFGTGVISTSYPAGTYEYVMEYIK